MNIQARIACYVIAMIMIAFAPLMLLHCGVEISSLRFAIVSYMITYGALMCISGMKERQ